MPQDRSLDEFLTADSDGESDAEADADDSDPEPDGSTPETPGSEPEGTVEEETSVEPEAPVEAASDVEGNPDVEPLATTYASSPDGGECATCGDVVEERWRDGGDLVCDDCKNW